MTPRAAGPPASTDAEGRADRDFMQSLSRGLAVLGAFETDLPHLTASRIADRTDLPRAVVRRCLLTLVREGYMRQDGKGFALTPKVLRFGLSYLASQPFWGVAQPPLQKLAQDIGETASLAVLDGTDVVFVHVARAPGRRILQLNIETGSRMPAHATALGRVLLSDKSGEELTTLFPDEGLARLTSRTVATRSALITYVERARELGWALADEELEAGLRSIAVPVRDASRRIVAGLNLTCLASVTDVSRMIAEFAPRLQQAAKEIGPVATALERASPQAALGSDR